MSAKANDDLKAFMRGEDPYPDLGEPMACPSHEPERFQTVEQMQAQIASLTAQNESLRSALKPRVSNVSEDQVAAAWAAWDDCHDAEQADNPMRAALEASHLIFVRRALQIADNTRAALQLKEGAA